MTNNQGYVEVWIRGVGSSNNTELGDPAAATHLNGVQVYKVYKVYKVLKAIVVYKVKKVLLVTSV